MRRTWVVGILALPLLNLPLRVVSDQYHAILTRRLTPILTQPHVQRKNFSTHLVKPGLFPCASRNSGNARWHNVVSRCGTTTAVRTEPQPPSVNAQRRSTKGPVTWFTLLRVMFYPEMHLVFISNKEDISRKSFANSYPWILAQQ